LWCGQHTLVIFINNLQGIIGVKLIFFLLLFHLDKKMNKKRKMASEKSSAKSNVLYEALMDHLKEWNQEKSLITLIVDYACSYDTILGTIQNIELLNDPSSNRKFWTDRSSISTETMLVRYRTPIEEDAHPFDADEWPESDTAAIYQGLWIRTKENEEYFCGISEEHCRNGPPVLVTAVVTCDTNATAVKIRDTKTLEKQFLDKQLTHFDWRPDQNEIGYYVGKIQLIETHPVTKIETEYTIMVRLACEETDYDPHHVFVCLKNFKASFEGDRQYNN